MKRCAALLISLWAGAVAAFGVDAPELARPGEFGVGLRTLRLVERDQADVLRYAAPAAGSPGGAPHTDRPLEVEVWYPARPVGGAKSVVYRVALPSEPPAPAAQFSFPGAAVRDSSPAGKDFPLVVVSHGYSNDPFLMSWLAENLATKGYVVAGLRHADPPITDRAKFAQPLLRRPLDIAFAMRALQEQLGAEHLVDPRRSALIGYSIGGYGVLTAAGAVLDPDAPVASTLVPGGLMLPYARGGVSQASLAVPHLKAVVAISPAGGGTLDAWGAAGLAEVAVPLLLIAGDVDRTVNYQSGARAFFDAAVHAQRYLLTFHLGGHALGLNPAPLAMRGRLWDQDWFEDPVWRKERVNAIEAHFITAFLDRYVKDEETRAAYLDVGVSDSTSGTWPPAQQAAAYDAVSPGEGGAGETRITLWKGFQRNHATGLELLHAAAE